MSKQVLGNASAVPGARGVSGAGARYFLEARKANGNAAFVGLSAAGKCRRWKVRSMQPSTRGFLREEPETLAADTSPPGEMLKAMPTLPLSVGS